MALNLNRVDASAATVQRTPATADSIVATLSKSHPVPTIQSKVLRFLAWVAFLLAFVVFNYFAIEYLHPRDTRVFNSAMGRENGPLEIAQLMALVPALALFWFAGVRGIGAVRVGGALLAMISAIVLVRELDFSDPAGGSSWFARLWDHGLQAGLETFFGLAVVLYLFLKRQYFWSLVRLGLRWQAWPCVAAILLLATAQFYIEDLPYDSFGQFRDFRYWEFRFWEELVEANGYLMLLLAAWRHSLLIGDPELDAPAEAAKQPWYRRAIP